MLKRLMSVFLAMVMCLSMLPVTVLAQEESAPQMEVTEASEPAASESETAEAEASEPEETAPPETTYATVPPTEETLPPAEIITPSEEPPEEIIPETTVETVPETTEETLPETTEQLSSSSSFANQAAQSEVTASGECGTGVTWQLADGVLTISGTGDIKGYYYHYYAPWYQYRDEIEEIHILEGVAGIGENAFGWQTNVKKVTIADTVTSIGESAFFCCTAMESITMPSQLTSIGVEAFRSCEALTAIDIPDGVTEILKRTFVYCDKLETVELPASLTAIGDDAFSDCTLSTLDIPSGVKTIGANAFWRCQGLTRVTLPAGLTSIGNDAFAQCTQLLSVEIPDSVTTIGSMAFAGCTTLPQATLPSGITELKMGTFSGCSSLQRITIPDSVTTIENSVFNNCSALESVTLSANLTEMGTGVFSKCTALQEIHIPAGITTIKSSTFAKCEALSRVTFAPESQLTTIEKQAFEQCQGLLGIDIPDSVTTIGDYAFYACISMEYVNLPDQLTTIGGYAFYYCELVKELTIPKTVVSMGQSAFTSWHSLEKLTIEEGVTDLGSNAFSGRNLIRMTIPASITSVKEYAFNCNARHFVFVGNAPSFDANAFGNARALVYYPKNATGWSKVIKNQYGGELTWIAYESLEELDFIASARLSEKMIWVLDNDGTLTFSGTDTKIPNYYPSTPDSPYTGPPWEFLGDKIKKVVLPDTLTEIGAYAFYGLENLEEVVLPAKLKTIYEGAFTQTPSLKKIRLPDGAETIFSYAFKESGLEEVYLPGSLEYFDGSIFWGCRNLKKLTIEEGITRIGFTMFQGTALQDLILPSTITGLTMECFADIDTLKTVTFKGSQIRKIGDAFKRDSTDTLVIYYPGGGNWDTIMTEDLGCNVEWRLDTPHDCQWDAGVVITQADCYQEGLKTFTCTVCKRTRDEIIPITHQEEAQSDGWEPTCTGDGATNSIICALCKEVLKEQEVIPALGHDEIWTGIADATCLEKGYTGDMRCDHCGDTQIGAYTEALGHLPELTRIPETAATETAYGHGILLVDTCTRCNEWLDAEGDAMEDAARQELLAENILYYPAQGVVIEGAANNAKVDPQDLPGGQLQLTARVLPEAAADQEIQWSSSPASVATVDEDGLVTFLKNGKVTITAAGANKRKAKVTLNVVTLARDIQFSENSGELGLGKSMTLKATITTPGVSNKKLLWTLAEGDAAYASISGTGVLKAKAIPEAGSVTVIVSSADGNASQTQDICIYPLTTSVTLQEQDPDTEEFLASSGGKKDMSKADRIILKAVSAPEGASGNVNWRSSKPNVAEVREEEGVAVVTLKAPGKADIIAEATDGSKKSAKYKLEVVASVTGLTLEPVYDVAAGKSITLKPVFTPAYATDKSVVWHTSDANLASISKKGVLKAHAKAAGVPEGAITVSVSTPDGSVKSNEAAINIYSVVSGVQLSHEGALFTGKSYSLYVGETASFSATTTPSGASKDISWTSSKPAVLELAIQGNTVTFQPKAAGTATVTAAATDGSGKKATIVVTVKQKVDSIDILGEHIVAVGKQLKLTAQVGPKNANNKKIIWSVADEDKAIATITSKGVLTVKERPSSGAVTVYASSEDGGAITGYTVRIFAPVTSMKLTRWEDGGEALVDTASIYVNMHQDTYLGVAVNDGASADVIWSSSTKSVATVDENGCIIPIKPGSTTITAAAIDGSKAKVSVKVNVIYPVTSLELPAAAVIAGGKTLKLTPVYNSNATQKTVVWTTEDDPAVISLDKKGNLRTRGVTAPTTVTVTAAATDGSGLTASCEVTIWPAASKVTLTQDGAAITAKSLTMSVEKLLQLGAVVTGKAGGPSQKVIWSSSNSKVARVTDNGLVIPVGPGTVKITATAADGTGQKATITVKIVQPVRSLSILGAATLAVGKKTTFKVTVGPANASNKKVVWYLDPEDSAYATLSTNGELKAKAVPEGGTITVYVKAADGYGTVATHQVTLVP